MDLDNVTPMRAMQLLHEWQDELGKEKS
jgi:hypothetical protein